MTDKKKTKITKQLLRETRNEREWNIIVSMLEIFDPYYHSNWWAEEILASGFAAECEKNWS